MTGEVLYERHRSRTDEVQAEDGEHHRLRIRCECAREWPQVQLIGHLHWRHHRLMLLTHAKHEPTHHNQISSDVDAKLIEGRRLKEEKRNKVCDVRMRLAVQIRRIGSAQSLRLTCTCVLCVPDVFTVWQSIQRRITRHTRRSDHRESDDEFHQYECAFDQAGDEAQTSRRLRGHPTAALGDHGGINLGGQGGATRRGLGTA